MGIIKMTDMKKGVPTGIAKDVAEYLKPLPSTVKKTLQQLRKSIKTAAPNSEEVISYQIPSYKQNGALVHFAAFPKHCSFFVVSKNILRMFQKELREFKTSGTTIHFTPDKPIPSSLVAKIVKIRVNENEERVAVKELLRQGTKVNAPAKISRPRSGIEIKGDPALTAAEFIRRIYERQSDKELKKIQRYFKSGKGEYGEGDKFVGIRMGELFSLAKEFSGMPVVELSKLLDHEIHEIRAGAVSIMDKDARSGKIADSRRKELFDLYFDRIDRINNWDLVDLGAPFVVGRYLADKDRSLLYKLASSKNIWHRRTAIVSTAYFLRIGDVKDTFAIAEKLLKDKEDLVHKAAGGWVRQAGKQAPKRLIEFLNKHASSMPRTMLRYATEKLDKTRRDYYLNLKKN
jgi:3-methyladenine DNA glycosylase AlkD/uncharacterized protein YdhG (YjbR/CyaY superfamily)